MIPKPGKDKKLDKNHRPISLLPCLGKVYERVIAKRLSSHIQFNSNLFPLDHGLEILNSAAMNKIVRSRERATIGHWAPKHNGNT